MKEKTAEWVAKAEGDFETAQTLHKHGTGKVSDSICFHCQQCAEKYLKGYLDEHGMAFPKEHPLLPLLKLACMIEAEFETLKPQAESMENYAVAIRYPGAAATPAAAEAALEAAARVRTFIRAKLELPN